MAEDQVQRRPADKRIRLTGERFDGGRLPIDSLVELERYQTVLRKLAIYEWRRDHPDEDAPEDLDASVSLTITSISPGSADVLLAFEQHAVYAEYQAEAQQAADATVVAAYSGAPLPELPELSESAVRELREDLAEVGGTLVDGQSIEFYSTPDAVPVVITVESRKQAVNNLILTDWLVAPAEAPASSSRVSEKHEESIVGRVTAVNAETTRYEVTTSTGKLHGWYRDNTSVLDDLRTVLNSAAEGPLTRITGELQFQPNDGVPYRFWNTSRVERVEFDDTSWGARLTEFARMPSNWADGGEAQISFIALDAAQHVLKAVDEAGRPTPGVFPTPEGGVLLEWSSTEGIRSVEILEDGTFELFSLRPDQAESVHQTTEDASEAIRFATEPLA